MHGFTSTFNSCFTDLLSSKLFSRVQVMVVSISALLVFCISVYRVLLHVGVPGTACYAMQGFPTLTNHGSFRIVGCTGYNSTWYGMMLMGRRAGGVWARVATVLPT